MGTFHENLGELHGITVVVDTASPKIFIGRCHEITPEQVILDDVDMHEEAPGGLSKKDYVAKASKVGIWKKWNRLTIPRAEVKSVQTLGSIS